MRSPILVTGGAGFIGSNFVLRWLATEKTPIVVLDNLTYAGNFENLAPAEHDARFHFVRGDICDRELLDRLFTDHRPHAVVHFAAESHVDRSILGPSAFVRTNIQGTFELLEASRKYWNNCRKETGAFRFLHVSTDEVYGSLGPHDAPFTESTRFAPNSPYSASKAASDHLVRAYHQTYGVPVLTTNCSNNYGPRQFPEKLIPLTIINSLKRAPLPVYGDGRNVRDWLYVLDHCDGIRAVLAKGIVGETYNLGGCQELSNVEVVRQVCRILDEVRPASAPYENLITFVKDRPGHDLRYAMDITKIERELGWHPRETFVSGLRKTITWYMGNESWIKNVTSGSYREWLNLQYGAAASLGKLLQ